MDDTIAPAPTPLRGAFTCSTLYTIPGVGHIPQLEDPATFNRVLLTALEIS